jgi:hypothetical protein
MSKVYAFIVVVVLVSSAFLASCWLFAETCPETKVKNTMCGNRQASTNGNVGCRHFTCAGHLYPTLGDVPPCASREQIVKCTESAPISEEDNHPEQTKTRVDILADQIVCYTYYACRAQLITNNCVSFGEEKEHKVSPLATFPCQ